MDEIARTNYAVMAVERSTYPHRVMVASGLPLGAAVELAYALNSKIDDTSVTYDSSTTCDFVAIDMTI